MQGMKQNSENISWLTKWLNNDINIKDKQPQENKEELEKLMFVLEDIAKWKLPDFDIEKSYQVLKNKRDNIEGGIFKIHRLRPYLKYASIVVLVLGFYLTWSLFFSPQEVRIATGIGETKDFTLPDGSIIQMDAFSEVTFNKNTYASLRRIELEGQAWFKVEKGEPFSVKTTNGTVEVLGTQFNVCNEDSLLEVKCYTGKVKVIADSDSSVLTQGMGVRIKNKTAVKLQFDEQNPDWVDGYTVYKNESLSHVVDDLKRYYAIKIKLPLKYHKLEFSGKVPHNQLSQALKVIFVPMEIPYVLSEDEKEVIFKK